MKRTTFISAGTAAAILPFIPSSPILSKEEKELIKGPVDLFKGQYTFEAYYDINSKLNLSIPNQYKAVTQLVSFWENYENIPASKLSVIYLPQNHWFSIDGDAFIETAEKHNIEVMIRSYGLLKTSIENPFQFSPFIADRINFKLIRNHNNNPEWRMIYKDKETYFPSNTTFERVEMNVN